jgi:hypothetical protein
MRSLIPYFWASGVIHLAVAAANLVLPSVLQYRSNLAKVSPIIRQIFIAHSAYIVLNLLAFAGLCFFFAPELAGGTRLGGLLSGYMALFWIARFCIQAFYFEEEVKRQHPAAHVAFLLAVAYMGGVAVAAAVGAAG